MTKRQYDPRQGVISGLVNGGKPHSRKPSALPTVLGDLKKLQEKWKGNEDEQQNRDGEK